ncbi:hypothetical protein ABDK00_013155 [Niabella insulamsoli]|uniref:hypothetical protein n=1 Tax=Niabella insulamsoli TaxID=3144874 RepID=UPI0031FC8FAD
MQQSVRSILMSLIISAANSAGAYGQAVDRAADKEKPTLTVGEVACSNADFYGQTAAEPLPYIALAASFNLPAGIYFSAATYRVFSEEMKQPFLAASALGVGYLLDVRNNLEAGISYTHNFFPSNTALLQAGVTGTATAEIKWQHWAETKATFDYLMGQSNDYFLTVGNAKVFDLHIPSEKAVLALAPEIAVAMGSQQFYQTYLINRENNGKGKGMPPPLEQQLAYNKFGIVSYNFKIPLDYNRARYLLELAYQLSLLGINALSGPGRANSMLSLSAFYQF